jgi:hypothetical protein
MSNIKLKPIADGIMDDLLNTQSKYDNSKLDFKRVTGILQSRIKPIKIKHWGVYSVKFGKQFVAVPKIKLEKNSFEYKIDRPSSVREPGIGIIHIGLSFTDDNIRVYIGGKYLNYYNIDSGLINNIEDNLETSLKNASNYYNSLDDAIINKILSMFKRNLQNAASNEDIYMSSYNNITT